MVEAVDAWKAQQRAAMEVQLKLEEESLARLEAAKASDSQHGASNFGSAASGDDAAWDGPGFTKARATGRGRGGAPPCGGTGCSAGCRTAGQPAHRFWTTRSLPLRHRCGPVPTTHTLWPTSARTHTPRAR